MTQLEIDGRTYTDAEAQALWPDAEFCRKVGAAIAGEIWAQAGAAPGVTLTSLDADTARVRADHQAAVAAGDPWDRLGFAVAELSDKVNGGFNATIERAISLATSILDAAALRQLLEHWNAVPSSPATSGGVVDALAELGEAGTRPVFIAGRAMVIDPIALAISEDLLDIEPTQLVTIRNYRTGPEGEILVPGNVLYVVAPEATATQRTGLNFQEWHDESGYWRLAGHVDSRTVAWKPLVRRFVDSTRPA